MLRDVQHFATEECADDSSGEKRKPVAASNHGIGPRRAPVQACTDRVGEDFEDEVECGAHTRRHDIRSSHRGQNQLWNEDFLRDEERGVGAAAAGEYDGEVQLRYADGNLA